MNANNARYALFKLVLFTLWLSVIVSCGGQPTEDLQDGGVAGVPRPSVLLAIPAGPANNNTVTVGGTATASAALSLYTDSACSAFVSSTTVAADGTWQFSVTVSDDTSTSYYAKQITASGPSACSTTYVTYVEDSSASAPTLSSTPSSPGNSNTPVITGTTESSATVTIYSDAGCSTQIASGSANSAGAFSITSPSIPSDAVYTYYASITDVAGNVSSCSAGYAYTEDSTLPAVPTVSSATPAGPANNNAPVINGTGEANSNIYLYSSAACSTLLGQGAADGAGNFSVTATVSDETSNTIYARSTDAAGNASACSSTFVTYIEDSGTVVPTLTSLSIGSPTNINTQNVIGTAEANATVNLYSNSACSASLASGSADGSGNFTISVTVADNSTTTIYAKATDTLGNNSACTSSPLTLVEDSTAPAAPSVTSTSPSTPASTATPTASGTAEASSSVVVYSDAGCTTSIGSGSANGSGNFAIGVTLGVDGTYTLYAKATDAAGNISACSAAPYNHVKDSTAPATPSITGTTPGTPGSSTTPAIAGTAEASSTVKIFSDASCTSQIGSGTTSGGGAFTVINVTLSGDGAKTFYANATDAAGNVSGCSGVRNYVLDTTAPSAPSISGSTPTSPSNNNSPVINGTAEANAGVKLYSDASCSTQIGTGTASGGGAFAITPTAPLAADTTHSIYAKATDAAGNGSACSSVYSYVEDSTAPTVPTISSSSPASPSSTNSPFIIGSTEANATVFLYSDPSCTTQIATSAADSGGAFSIGVTYTADTVNYVYSKSQDAAGNFSSCSTPGFLYVEDSTAPSAPSLTTSTPYLRSDLQAATIEGTAESGSAITIFNDASCTTQVGSGTTDGLGNFSVSITAPLNQVKSYYGKATDAANNASTCSVSTVSYEAYTIPNGVGFFTGTQTTAPATPTNMNQTTAYSLQYSTADFDSDYYTHSTVSSSERITVKVAGDYMVALNIPGTGATTSGQIKAEFKVNGTVRSATRAQNYYTSNTSGHTQSSIGASYLLEGLAVNDYIEATVIRGAAAGTISVAGKFSLYVENVAASRVIFTATATTGTGLSGGNINTPNTLAWTSSIKDSGFTHTNGSGSIILDSVGTYVIHANVPGSGAIANASVKVQANVNGTAVTGGEMKQGYISNTSGHNMSSTHWSGVVTTNSANSILNFSTKVGGATGVVRLMGAYPASIFIERLNSNGDMFYGQGTSLVSGADFNPATASPVTFTTENIEDGARFTHATSGTSEQVQVTTAGDYLLMFNAQNTSAGVRVNTKFQVTVNGTPVSGAESTSFYIRNTSSHTDSSGTMVYLLRRLNANDIVRVQAVRNTTITTATTNQNSSLVLFYKP